MPDRTVPQYDLILIGSGFASAFFLHKYLSLAKGAKKVLILERGFRHDLNWKLQNRDKMQPYGIVSDINYRDTFLNRNRDKDWVYNPSFGGGSNCWWACTPRFLPNDFRMKSLYGVGRDWPISYDDLEPYYSEAEEIMNVSGPEDHICRRSDQYPQPPHLLNEVDNVLKAFYPEYYFAQPTARARVATKTRPSCCASGVCYLCPVNAKFTIENDLRSLFETEGVDIAYGACVQSVNIQNDIVSSINYVQNGESNEVKGDILCLGANALFNAAIMQNSGISHPYLGSNLSEQASLSIRVFLKGLKNFGGSTSLTANGYMLYDGAHRKEYGGILLESSNVPTFRLEKGRHTEVAVFKAIIEDLPELNNKVTYSKKLNKPVATFYGYSDYVNKAKERFPSLLNKIFEPLPVEDIEISPYLSRSEAHILGTTVMGMDPQTSVVDADLIHHRYRNLFVLGGGAFPTISPSNPTLTICALSLRAAQRALR